MPSLIVKTPVFEGPLDLLLELIESRKLHINDVSLASVTDDYITRIQGMEELPVAETAEFIALAATLLLIKSRSLLPTLELSGEETRSIKELEYRLAIYQIIKEASKTLGRQWGKAPMREGIAAELPPLYIPDASVTPVNLLAAMRRVMEEFPQTVTLPKIAVKKIISLEEMIEQLAARVNSALKLSFRDFSGLSKKTEKTNIIVSFLALLELVKRGNIRANQQSHYSDITLEQEDVSVPSYASE